MIARCAGVLALVACQSGDVGFPCVPEEEYVQDFPGFSLGEVNFESRSFQCESRLCLVHHFQGRVSCPYGQSEREANGSAACSLPDGHDPVRVAVNAQALARRADDAVYCSCRCDGPDPKARYCDCPDGFSCRELTAAVAARDAQLAGSYCVKNGTEYESLRVDPGAVCDRARANCD